jgi:hypothetical protein
MGCERCIRYAEVIDEFTVAKNDDFFGKPLSAEQSGEPIMRGRDDNKALPGIATATAFDACEFRVENRSVDSRMKSLAMRLLICSPCSSSVQILRSPSSNS